MAATKSDLHLIWQRAEFSVRPISIGRAEHGLRRGSWPMIAGVTRTHRERWIFIGRLLRREIMGDDPHDPAPSDGWENAWKSPRSWRDRTAIAVRSSRDRDSFMAESSPRSSDDMHWRIETTINSRSWPDRGAIVALLKKNWGLIPCRSGSHDVAPRNRSHDASNASHDQLNCPRFLGQFHL